MYSDKSQSNSRRKNVKALDSSSNASSDSKPRSQSPKKDDSFHLPLIETPMRDYNDFNFVE